jgi:hypothetical protein
LTLVAGAAFAAFRLLSPAASPVAPASGAPAAQLKVTGTPPTAQQWSEGYEEAWRIDPNLVVSRADPNEGSDEPVAYAGRSGRRVLFTVDTSTASGTAFAIDQGTGKRLWSVYSGETCGGIVNGEKLRCQGGRMGYYPTDLVDLATGESAQIPSSQELGAKIPDGKEDYFRWSTFVIDGILFAGWLDEEATGAVQPKLHIARLTDDGSRFAWTSQRPVSGTGIVTDTDAIPTSGRITHNILTARWGALDASNGDVILDGSGSDQPAVVQWVAQDVLQGGDQVSAPRRITAPDGTSVAVVGVGGISVTTAALPKHPLRETADGVAAFDPLSGADSLTGPTLWETKLGVPSSDAWTLDNGTNGDYLLAYHDGRIAVVGQPGTRRNGLVAMLDEQSGALLWQSSVVGAAGGDGRDVLVPTFTGDGQLLVQSASAGTNYNWEDGNPELTMFSASNGDVMWARPGVIAAAQLATLDSAPIAPEVESEDGIVVNNVNGTYSLLSPKASTVSKVPAEAPGCPSGMTAISWTQYADGAILLCRSDSTYVVVFPAHPDWPATNLDFSGGGYQVAFGNGTRVRVTLGGQVVYTDAGGNTTAQPATRSWNNAAGEVKVAVPSGLPACPAGSWPISLSTYDGGWLLVCGTSADAPTSMKLSDGTGVTDVGSVAYRNGGYCGTADVGTVCGYRSPAVVSVTDASGKVTQHSAESNYFDGHGQGGVGKGNGSYGVESPDDNAKDQVRYLTQILQKSMAGRANLQSAVDKVRACSDLAGALTSFNDVLANRQELLDALDSTPVDAVPNGSELVASLRNALQLSHDSDQVWLQWAQAEQANGCAEGENSALYRQVRAMNENVAAAKDAFLSSWNSQIASAYGAPEFKTSQI